MYDMEISSEWSEFQPATKLAALSLVDISIPRVGFFYLPRSA